MELKYGVWLLLTLVPSVVFGIVLAIGFLRGLAIARQGHATSGRIIDIRTFKAGRSKSVCPIVEVCLPGEKAIAVRTGEQNIFTRYQVGQTVPVILIREHDLLRVYINTRTERVPPLLLLLCVALSLASIPALMHLAQ